MSELTRKEKAIRLYEETECLWHMLGKITDQEIDELYNEHFNKVTEEDFEGFKKVCDKYRVMVFRRNDLDHENLLYIDQIKKELGL